MVIDILCRNKIILITAEDGPTTKTSTTEPITEAPSNEQPTTTEKPFKMKFHGKFHFIYKTIRQITIYYKKNSIQKEMLQYNSS